MLLDRHSLALLNSIQLRREIEAIMSCLLLSIADKQHPQQLLLLHNVLLLMVLCADVMD